MRQSVDEIFWQKYVYLEIFGLPVVLRSNAPELAARIEYLMRSFVAPRASREPAALLMSIAADKSNRASPHLYAVYRDHTFIGETPDAAHAFRLIEWQLDMLIAEAVGDVFLLHAGAVARNGTGIILPGESGHGKSSLTMGLMLDGCHYLSDELAVIDPAAARLHPFPKPFSIKNIQIFSHLTDQKHVWFGPDEHVSNAAKAHNPGYYPVWYIHPEDVRPNIVSEPVTLRYIVFPTYNAHETLQLTPLSSGDAMQRLLENSVNLAALGQTGFRLLAQLVRQSTCYALTFPNLEAGVAAVRNLLDVEAA